MLSQRTYDSREGHDRAITRLIGLCAKLKRILKVQNESGLDFCKPGLRYGPLPIKHESPDRRSWLDRFVSRCLTYRERCKYTVGRSSDWLERIARRKKALAALTAHQLDANRDTVKRQMQLAKPSEESLDDALAHALVAVESVQQLIPRSNQCLAARAMLRGYSVEMATGEGKTLSVGLAAGASALSGTPVHVLTANDYLAERDAASLSSYYEFMGLRVASVVSSQSSAERRQAYSADIVYVTAKQVAFDWLNDSIELSTKPDSLTARLSALTNTASHAPYQPILRGLCLAFVDEADSLLVDEARIPLVLAAAQSSHSSEDTEAVIALGLAEHLREGIDYRVLSTTRLIQLTDHGRSELSRISSKVAHVWQSTRYREERVAQALTVLHRFERDRDYIVRDGQLDLMDAHTGRAMPDRRLPHGLHRLLEVKEKCVPSPQQETIAAVAFQHFFKRYIGLVGISGTMDEVSSEIHHVYQRLIVPVPSHRPCQRIDLPVKVYKDRSTALEAMVEDVKRRQDLKQPVLVCTRSVEQSLGVSGMLKAHGVIPRVLNAYQDAEEAAIVAAAGKAGAVTVATNMAGRGTDIPLGAGVAELGGLHVISLAFNDARRLDRQLAGRAARQGDPGSFQQFYCVDDPFLIEAMPTIIQQSANQLADRGLYKLLIMLVRTAQRRMEWQHRKQRLALFHSRESLERRLAFGGQANHQS